MGILSLFFALIGLGFLILIHEIGHYLMARLAGIRVETFSIGMGRPIYYFLHKGVKIQLGWIPFGGYVKMAGERAEDQDNPEGFFAKSPWKRILVAFFGPLANILFALLVFFIIWTAGGREKAYSDITSRVGWVDPSSELYVKGVRPGDRVVSYNGKAVSGAKDHFYAAMTAGPSLQVEVEKFRKTDVDDNLILEVAPYQHPLLVDKGLMTTGVLSPASFLIWNPPQGEDGLSKAAQKSGIQPSDRLVWVDGEPLFSQAQLGSLLNDGCQLVTIIRSGKVLHLHIPRLHIDELKLAQKGL
jgi:regulator of sigma E protease